MTDYATLLRDHTTLTCRCIDRIFLQAWVPQLQSVGQVCKFLHHQRGFPIPSSAAFGQIGRAYVKDIHRFAESNSIPVIRFQKGEDKEDIARPLIDAAARKGGQGRVVMVGIAQERASAWVSWPAKGQRHLPHPHMEWDRQMKYPNHFYFYVWDPEWGGAFLKTNAYAPYPIWLWLNGHSWAQRQLDKRSVAYDKLDNGFLSCEDPKALHQICNRLGPGAVKDFFWRWIRRLPSPFTDADRRAGYVYDLAFRQFEVADTRVLDRPQSGRVFFEGMIRDHLDIGRPSTIQLFFPRKITSRTPGVFRTRVITKGVDPYVTANYKHSRVRQYFKDGRALRTETLINDTYDFGIGRRVCQQNWRALRAVGCEANTRLLDAQAQDARPIADVATFDRVTRPSTTDDGLYAPSLRFGDPRVMALLAALLSFCHVLAGFTNRSLRALVAAMLGCDYGSHQATYDLRRLTRKGLIVRVSGTHRYQVTPFGRQVAVAFVKTYSRVLTPAIANLNPRLPPNVAERSPLAVSWRRFDRAFDEFVEQQMIAA